LSFTFVNTKIVRIVRNYTENDFFDPKNVHFVFNMKSFEIIKIQNPKLLSFSEMHKRTSRWSFHTSNNNLMTLFLPHRKSSRCHWFPGKNGAGSAKPARTN